MAVAAAPEVRLLMEPALNDRERWLAVGIVAVVLTLGVISYLRLAF